MTEPTKSARLSQAEELRRRQLEAERQRRQGLPGTVDRVVRPGDNVTR